MSIDQPWNLLDNIAWRFIQGWHTTVSLLTVSYTFLRKPFLTAICEVAMEAWLQHYHRRGPGFEVSCFTFSRILLSFAPSIRTPTFNRPRQLCTTPPYANALPALAALTRHSLQDQSLSLTFGIGAITSYLDTFMVSLAAILAFASSDPRRIRSSSLYANMGSMSRNSAIRSSRQSTNNKAMTDATSCILQTRVSSQQRGGSHAGFTRQYYPSSTAVNSFD